MQRFQWFLTVLLATLFFTPTALAAAGEVLPTVVAPTAVGMVTNVQGSLSATKTGVAPRTLAVYDNVTEGEVLSTAAGAYARVKFTDGGELILRPNSQAEITRYAFAAATPASDSAIITLIKGGLRSLTGLMGKRNPEQVSFKTKTSTIGIRGTDFGLLECKNNCGDVMPPGTPPPPNGTHVDVAQGTVAVTTRVGQLVINAGQFAYVKSPTARPQLQPASKAAKVTVPPTIRKDPPPKPQAAASTDKNKTQAKSSQTQPDVASTTAPPSATSSSSGPQAATTQSQPTAASTVVPASTWTSTASIGNSADLGTAISQLPATAAGPIAQPTLTLPTIKPNSIGSFATSPASSLGGGGGRAISRN